MFIHVYNWKKVDVSTSERDVEIKIRNTGEPIYIAVALINHVNWTRDFIKSGIVKDKRPCLARKEKGTARRMLIKHEDLFFLREIFNPVRDIGAVRDPPRE